MSSHQKTPAMFRDLSTLDESKQIFATELVHEHIGWMLRLARSYLGDNALAEDAVQTAFTKIFERFDQFEGRSSLKNWIRQIVVNESLILLRKRSTTLLELDIDPLAAEFDKYDSRIEPTWGQVPTTEQFMIAVESKEIVSSAIKKLPHKYRVVLLLRDIEGESTATTAELLGVSEGSIKTRLHRARATLKILLEPYMRDRDISW